MASKLDSNQVLPLVLDESTQRLRVDAAVSASDAVLNQFAFNWNLTKDFYTKKSEYDADLYQGFKIKIVYKSVSAKTIGVNFNFDEVK